MKTVKQHKKMMTEQRFNDVRSAMETLKTLNPKIGNHELSATLNIALSTLARVKSTSSFAEYRELVRKYSANSSAMTAPKKAAEPAVEILPETSQQASWLIDALNRNTEAMNKLNTTLEFKKAKKLFRS